MIIAFLLRLVVNILSSLFGVVFPLLPSGFPEFFQQVVRWLQSGLGFVFLFVDRGFAASLISWWLSLMAIILSVELVVNVWRIITGHVWEDGAGESK